ncbi:hypothetical protein LSAT2_009576 [Lamellibrachia satsuma]|nr:hypothetical protein LSAT2_009576 [Lamellibrachia satsuma]
MWVKSDSLLDEFTKARKCRINETRFRRTSMDRVVVRRATPDDYDVIVRLSEGLYNGYDYVPDIYFKCLEDPNRYMQVAEWWRSVQFWSLTLVEQPCYSLVALTRKFVEKAYFIS